MQRSHSTATIMLSEEKKYTRSDRLKTSKHYNMHCQDGCKSSWEIQAYTKFFCSSLAPFLCRNIFSRYGTRKSEETEFWPNSDSFSVTQNQPFCARSRLMSPLAKPLSSSSVFLNGVPRAYPIFHN